MALATVPAAIQANPASFNLDPVKLEAFRAAVGGINYDVTGQKIGNNIFRYDAGVDELVTVATPALSYTLKAFEEDLILLNTAWRGIGNAKDNVMLGNNADNHLKGLGGNDVLIGGKGNDVLQGGDGNDVISGCEDNDDIDGGAGRDTVHGGTGKDLIDGGAGRDTLYGDEGDDLIHGDGDHDVIFGGADNDQLYGDAGNDTIDGEDGNDIIDGGLGNDVLKGGIGNDSISGKAGNDTIFGGDGTDSLNGELGNDTIYGGKGNDIVDVGTKGEGKDVFVWETGDGDDTVRDLDTQDRLDFRGAGGDPVSILNDGLGNTVVTMADGSKITLKGITASQLTDTDNDDIWDID